MLWLLDLLTVTSHYPGAAAKSGLDLANARAPYNAAWDSVKMVMDSSDGRMTFFVAGKSNAADPLLAAWRKRLPGLVRPVTEMPRALVAHRRYPPSLFQARAELLSEYGVASAEAFYGQQQQWDLDSDDEDDSSSRFAGVGLSWSIQARTAVDAPGAKQFELQTLLHTASRKPEALLRVACDGDDYGKLWLTRFEGLPADEGRRQTIDSAAPEQGFKVAPDEELEQGRVMPLLIRRAGSRAHLLLVQAGFVRRKLAGAAFGDTDAPPPRLKGILLSDAAAAGMAGAGADARAAARGLSRRLAAAEARQLTGLSPVQEALRAHDAAQAATRRGDWAAAGEWWRRERQWLEKMLGGRPASP
jgi:hypothetical protein